MAVSVHRKGRSTVARLSGDLDLMTADTVRSALDREIDRGCSHLVLNLKRVTFIDSSGLGVILGRYRRVDALGGQVTLVAVPPALRSVLDLAGLLKLLPVADDESGVALGG